MPVLDQSFTSEDTSGGLRYNATLESLAQQFTPTLTDVKEITVKLLRIGSPAGSIWMEIWSDTGSNLPNAQIGSDSVGIDVSTISTSAADYTFTFASAISLTPGTKYWFTIWVDYAVSETDVLLLRYKDGGGYSGGIPAQHNGTSWGTWFGGADDDIYFLEYSSNIAHTKSLSETVTIVDVISKLTSKVLEEVATLVDTITKPIGNNLDETVTLNSNMIKKPVKLFTEALSLSHNLIKKIITVATSWTQSSRNNPTWTQQRGNGGR